MRGCGGGLSRVAMCSARPGLLRGVCADVLYTCYDRCVAIPLVVCCHCCMRVCGFCACGTLTWSPRELNGYGNPASIPPLRSCASWRPQERCFSLPVMPLRPLPPQRTRAGLFPSPRSDIHCTVTCHPDPSSRLPLFFPSHVFNAADLSSGKRFAQAAAPLRGSSFRRTCQYKGTAHPQFPSGLPSFFFGSLGSLATFLIGTHVPARIRRRCIFSTRSCTTGYSADDDRLSSPFSRQLLSPFPLAPFLPFFLRFGCVFFGFSLHTPCVMGAFPAS